MNKIKSCESLNSLNSIESISNSTICKSCSSDSLFSLNSVSPEIIIKKTINENNEKKEKLFIKSVKKINKTKIKRRSREHRIISKSPQINDVMKYIHNMKIEEDNKKI